MNTQALVASYALYQKEFEQERGKYDNVMFWHQVSLIAAAAKKPMEIVTYAKDLDVATNRLLENLQTFIAIYPPLKLADLYFLISDRMRHDAERYKLNLEKANDFRDLASCYLAAAMYLRQSHHHPVYRKDFGAKVMNAGSKENALMVIRQTYEILEGTITEFADL